MAFDKDDNMLVPFRRPTNMAACSYERRSGVVLKYLAEAVLMPKELYPKSTVLRYIVKICSLFIVKAPFCFAKFTWYTQIIPLTSLLVKCFCKVLLAF